MNVLFIDNVDSFAYNVVHLLSSQGARVRVERGDDPLLDAALLDTHDALVIGPGPGRPEGFPAMMRVLAAAMECRMPVFGVCLGLQAIGSALGARVVHAPQLMHGKVSQITHNGTGLFHGIPSPLQATRYHSLCLDEATLPEALHVTARSEDGVIQAISHRTLPVNGVQFHPESILSQNGDTLIRNALSAHA